MDIGRELRVIEVEEPGLEPLEIEQPVTGDEIGEPADAEPKEA